MSVKCTQLKVSLTCEKSKTDVLKAVAKLQGVDSIAVNAEKGTVTIVGTVDPVCVVTQLRKAKICAEIISIGPPKKPEPEKPKPADCKSLSCSCQQCLFVPVGYPTYNTPGCWFW